MKIKLLRITLIVLTLFVGVGAIIGMMMMFIDPSGRMWGMDPLLEGLQVMPMSKILFKNFIFSGIVLFCVNGVTQLFAAILLFMKNKYAKMVSAACGIILMLWCALEWILWGFNFMFHRSLRKNCLSPQIRAANRAA